MEIDFGKLKPGGTADTVLQPREIFAALPNKKEGKFQYPRDEKWTLISGQIDK